VISIYILRWTIVDGTNLAYACAGKKAQNSHIRIFDVGCCSFNPAVVVVRIYGLGPIKNF
jgi:hypothetical protein